MLRYTRNTVTIATLLILLACTCIILIPAISQSSITADTWLGLAVLNIGIVCVSVYVYNLYHLERCGLESSSKQQRKTILRASYRGNLPSDPALHTAAKAYIKAQQALLRSYIILIPLSMLGTTLVLIGLSILGNNENNLFIAGAPPILYLAIAQLGTINRIQRNAKSLDNLAVDNEPPADDDRWWTGRW